MTRDVWWAMVLGAGERNDVRPVTDSDAYKCVAAIA